MPPEHSLVKTDRCKAVSNMTPENSKVVAGHPHGSDILSGLPTASRETEFWLREKTLEGAE